MSSIPQAAHTHPWTAHPVRGEGREERMEIVRHHLHRHHPFPLETASLMQQIESGAVKCRLVYENTVLKGIFIHSLHVKHDMKSFPRCIDFKAMSLLKGYEDRGDLQRLFQVATLSAEEHGARSTAFTTNRDDFLVHRFLLSEGCSQIASDGRSITLAKTLIDGGKKRRAEEDSTTASLSSFAPQRAKEELERTAAPQRFAPIQSALRITLKDLYIRQILSGKKTVEGRIFSGMFKNINTGRILEFFSSNSSVRCEVKGVRVYPSFSAMLEKEGYQNCVNEARSFDEALHIYESISGYKDRARQFGVVAIHIEKK